MALLAALFFGSAQFVNGSISAWTSGVAVARWNICSAALITGVIVAVIRPGVSFTGALWAVVAGVGGALSAAALYRSLEQGELSVAIPLCTITSVIIPVGVGLFFLSEPLKMATGLGLAAAIGAILLVTRSRPERTRVTAQAVSVRRAGPGAAPAQRKPTSHVLRVIGLPLPAGVGVAIELVGISRFPQENFLSLLWASFFVGAMIMLLIKTPSRPPMRPRHKVMVLFSGALTATGMTLFYTASIHIGLSLAGIIIGLYPVIPILLAILFLGERPHTLRVLGLALSGAAVLIIGGA